MTTILLIITAIALIFIGFAYQHLTDENKMLHGQREEWRESYNRTYELWMESAKKIQDRQELIDELLYSLDLIIERNHSLKQEVNIKEASISNLKKLNTSLRLSRNGVKGRYIQLLKEQKELVDLYSGWCENYAKKVYDLEMVNRLVKAELNQTNTKLPELSPAYDLPIGTKFRYDGMNLEVVEIDAGCGNCMFMPQKIVGNICCYELNKCHCTVRNDNKSVIYNNLDQ